MKIMITGANSYIGNYFKNKFKDNNHISEICLINNKLSDISFAGQDIIFHVAAIVHQSKEISENTYFKINSELAYSAAKKAKFEGVKQFVLMSTIKVYGEINDKQSIWTELSECMPQDSYGKSKLEAEKKVLSLQSDGFMVSIIRTPVVYGPNVKGNIFKVIGLIDRFPILPFKGINNIRAMIAIDNLVFLVFEVMRQKSAGIHLASDEKLHSSTELFNEIAKNLNKKRIFFSIPKFANSLLKIIKPGIVSKIYGSIIIDNSLTRKKLEYLPSTTFEEGIKKTIDWYKSL